MTCTICHASFEVPQQEQRLCERFGVSLPTLCPFCSWRRHAAFRNDRHLYRRTCDATKKEILSMYAPDSPYTIYDSSVWHADAWDARDYGKPVDFSRSFFEQFKELQLRVPRPHKSSLHTFGENINSEYTNFTTQLKNCYMVFSAGESEDCYYGELFYKSANCVDGLMTFYSEQCYEATDSERCFNCQCIQNCKNCTDCSFLIDCSDCQNCFGCVNLKSKQYCFFNKQLSKEEYIEKLKNYYRGSAKNLEKIKSEFYTFMLTQPWKHSHTMNAEQCSGDYIYNSKNCTNSFLCFMDCEDSTSLFRVIGIKDSARISHCDPLEIGYEVTNCTNYTGRMYELAFCMSCIGAVRALWYCDLCVNAQNCFGCVGIQGKSYCILNTQYSKEEYERIKDRVIAHMKETGEWGRFFPPSLSPFGFNETYASDYFPLTKEEAVQQGFNWAERTYGTYGRTTMPAANIEDDIKDIKDTIVEEVLECTLCTRNYKIIKQELAFYKKHTLPLPRQCFHCRHVSRLRLRNEMKLYRRQCMCELSGHDHAGRCPSEFETTYAPDRPERVFCESCHQREVL